MQISITIISDTHLRHRELVLPAGDLLIHCGDIFNLGTRNDAAIADVDDWFGQQNFKQVLCVGGNHDHVLQAALKVHDQPFKNAQYLQDEAYNYAGLNFYGSPWVPNLPFHAFSLDEQELVEAWSNIPKSTDVLITHSPPAGILDKSSSGTSHGCTMLARELERVRPRVHCFGHVHASAGRIMRDEISFINASSIESGTGEMLPPINMSLSNDDEAALTAKKTGNEYD